MITMTWPQYQRCECRLTVSLSHLEREMLSTLLIHYPLAVSIPDLIDAVYPDPDTDPLTADRQIECIAGRLRRKGIRIARDRRGYRLIQCAADLRRAA